MKGKLFSLLTLFPLLTPSIILEYLTVPTEIFSTENSKILT